MKTRSLITIGIILIVGTIIIFGANMMSDNAQQREQKLDRNHLATDSRGHCGEKYLEVGNGECELNPEFIEPNTVIIYDVYEKNGMRLSIAPHTILVNITGNDVVVFENDASNTVNIFISDGATPMPIFGNNAKRIQIFEGIKTIFTNDVGNQWHRILSVSRTEF